MFDPNILLNTIGDDPKLFPHDQIEEERLRSDILKYLANKSNGVYHYSVELRTITLDIIGLSFMASKQEFQEAEISLLYLLYLDPKRRFSIMGEGDHISVKRAPLDEDQIEKIKKGYLCFLQFLLGSHERESDDIEGDRSQLNRVVVNSVAFIYEIF